MVRETEASPKWFFFGESFLSWTTKWKGGEIRSVAAKLVMYDDEVLLFLGDAAFPIFSPPPVLEKDAPVSSLLSFWPGKSHRSPGEGGGGTGGKMPNGP